MLTGGSSRVPKTAHAMHTVVVSSNMVAEPGWSSEQISERICEQIADVHASQGVEQIIEVPKMAEKILDVLVLETVEQSVKLPSTVSEHRIQQRTAEHTAVIPVPQDVEELVEVFTVPKDRVLQRLAEQTIDTPISLAEKIVERPATQTQQVANTSVQQVVGEGKVEKRTIQEEINQVTRHDEISTLQFTDKVADIPVVAVREISQLQVDDKVVDVPVVLVVQAPLLQVMAETAEIPQLQIIDTVVDVPVVLVVPVSQVRVVQKTVEDSQFEIVEKTVENPETQISDVVIDACLTCDAKCMVACETCVKDNMFMVAGEITVAGKNGQL